MEQLNNSEISQLLGIRNMDWAELGAYVYAYYHPTDWTERIDMGGIGSSPTPFYVGIGTGRRAVAHIKEAIDGGGTNKHYLIREIIAQGQMPDIRILAYGLNDNIDGKARELIETVLISLYGKETRGNDGDEFDVRMGFPSALTNRAASSTEVKAGAIASIAGSLRKGRDRLFDLDEIIDGLRDDTGIDAWLTIGVNKSFDPRANIDQLKTITCSWWPSDVIPDGSFGVIGVSSDNLMRAGTVKDSTLKFQVPVIRSVYTIGDGREYDSDGAKVSFVRWAVFSSSLWNANVGKRLSYTSAQLQGQKTHPINTDPASSLDLSTTEIYH